jgi:hypothetical protein
MVQVFHGFELGFQYADDIVNNLPDMGLAEGVAP